MKREAGVNPPLSYRALQGGVDRGEVARDRNTQSTDASNAHDGDEADEHAVFDESRTLVVFRKASNQFTHGKYILFRVNVITGLATPYLS